MAVALDNTFSGESVTGTVTVNITVANVANRVAYVCVCTWQDTTSITLNGTSMGSAIYDAGIITGRIAVYRAIAPAAGTYDVVAVVDGVDYTTVGVFVFNGVDQATPNDAADAISGGTETNAVATAAGDMVFDCQNAVGPEDLTITATGDNTLRWAQSDVTANITTAGSTHAATDASSDMNWDLNFPNDHIGVAFNVNAGAAELPNDAKIVFAAS